MGFMNRVLLVLLLLATTTIGIRMVMANVGNGEKDLHMSIDIPVTIDRIEGDLAVLLVNTDEVITVEWPVILLPPECGEGQVLNISVSVDMDETHRAIKRISDFHKYLLK